MPSLDYDVFLHATLSVTSDMYDVEQDFCCVVFNVVAHNRNDHVRQHVVCRPVKMRIISIAHSIDDILTDKPFPAGPGDGTGRAGGSRRAFMCSR